MHGGLLYPNSKEHERRKAKYQDCKGGTNSHKCDKYGRAAFGLPRMGRCFQYYIVLLNRHDCSNIRRKIVPNETPLAKPIRSFAAGSTVP